MLLCFTGLDLTSILIKPMIMHCKLFFSVYPFTLFSFYKPIVTQYEREIQPSYKQEYNTIILILKEQQRQMTADVRTQLRLTPTWNAGNDAGWRKIRNIALESLTRNGPDLFIRIFRFLF